jgi:hypothetical protein
MLHDHDDIYVLCGQPLILEDSSVITDKLFKDIKIKSLLIRVIYDQFDKTGKSKSNTFTVWTNHLRSQWIPAYAHSLSLSTLGTQHLVQSTGSEMPGLRHNFLSRAHRIDILLDILFTASIKRISDTARSIIAKGSVTSTIDTSEDGVMEIYKQMSWVVDGFTIKNPFKSQG